MGETLKNIELSTVQNLKDLVEVKKGEVVSRNFARNEALSLTLFAFPEGEGLSPHTAPGDALIQCLEGKVKVMIDNVDYNLKENDSIVMPANVIHAVTAISDFKMLLTLVKQ